MPARCLPRFRRLVLRRGAVSRAGSRDWAPRTAGGGASARRVRRSRGRRVLSLVASLLMVPATGLVTLAVPATATAAAGGTYVTHSSQSRRSASGMVTPINLTTNTPETAIPVGTIGPQSIAITTAQPGVQVPARAIGGILLTGLVAVVFVGYQLTRSPSRRRAAPANGPGQYRSSTTGT